MISEERGKDFEKGKIQSIENITETYINNHIIFMVHIVVFEYVVVFKYIIVFIYMVVFKYNPEEKKINFQ